MRKWDGRLMDNVEDLKNSTEVRKLFERKLFYIRSILPTKISIVTNDVHSLN